MGRLRIAVWHNLPSGGGKRQLYNHVKGLVERGHYVESWCPETADQKYLPFGGLIKEHTLPLKETSELFYHSVRPFPVLRRLLSSLESHCETCAAEINSGGFDVLYANGCMFLRTSPIAKYTALPSAIYLNEPYRWLYEAMPELPWIAPQGSSGLGRAFAAIREILFGRTALSGMRHQARAELEYARQFDLILANSVYSRESILRAYNLDSKICYLGIDTDFYHPAGEKKEQYVVGLGTIYHGKGIDRAIRALATISPKWRPPLVWIGNGASAHDLKGYSLLAKELSVQFEARTNIPDEEVIRLLSHALVMVYTSRLEPFGLAPLEANACGTPVVGIAEGGIRETIRDGVNGLLARHDDSRELGELISRFVRDVRLSEAMGKQAREYVMREWNMKKCTENIEGYLLGLHSEKAGVKRLKCFSSGKLPEGILVETGDMKYGIDSCRFKAGHLDIRGWAFIDDGKDAFNCETFIVVEAGQNTRVFKPSRQRRPDVTEFFGSVANYDDSGFHLDTGSASGGKGAIGIAIVRGEKLSYQRIRQIGV